ncbi:MAG TPA: M14 metallopeptidase family protein, partial [Edaphobacter sp.]|nr:M14 metallopeptidase family protein [Edaphobacter sp.]
MKLRTLPLSLFILTLFAVLQALSQTAEPPRKITTPKQALGFNIGDDYYLANYVQLTSYWQTLAKESDRMKLVDIGPTAENRRQYMAIISSPENIAKLEHYKEISAKLARAENLTDAEAHGLSEEGRAIVWIDGGLHASETVGAQQLLETVYQLNALTDPETLRFLHDDIILCVLDNPDGMDLVADWYMREPTPEKRVTEGPAGTTPRLWQKYIGHDNNRDFYMNNMPESTNISHILFREWYPQIMYNHHQTGPLGTVIFMPPFRDPFNYHYDPLIPLKIEAVGTAMHERLVEEGKPGSGMRSTANYSTWYNGGLRTVTYF